MEQHHLGGRIRASITAGAHGEAGEPIERSGETAGTLGRRPVDEHPPVGLEARMKRKPEQPGFLLEKDAPGQVEEHPVGRGTSRCIRATERHLMGQTTHAHEHDPLALPRDDGEPDDPGQGRKFGKRVLEHPWAAGRLERDGPTIPERPLQRPGRQAHRQDPGSDTPDPWRAPPVESSAHIPHANSTDAGMVTGVSSKFTFVNTARGIRPTVDHRLSRQGRRHGPAGCRAGPRNDRTAAPARSRGRSRGC